MGFSMAFNGRRMPLKQEFYQTPVDEQETSTFFSITTIPSSFSNELDKHGLVDESVEEENDSGEVKES
ncbi:hypothetical protein ACJIZ3_021751 [Penstemon smallii]|uniref:Uncharacterized protein n=1 Tax=Penstemon smallii TaxID=265156 RepID=A0ABD3SMB3_9LAMI